MKKIYYDFDELGLFESICGKAYIQTDEKSNQAKLVVPIFNLGIDEEPTGLEIVINYADKAYLVFENVVSSKRTIKKYTDNNELEDESHQIVDIEKHYNSILSNYEIDFFRQQIDSNIYIVTNWFIKADNFCYVLLDESRFYEKLLMITGDMANYDYEDAVQFLNAEPPYIL